MTTQSKKDLCWCLFWLVLFFGLTCALCTIDVQPAGPQNSTIGLAGINTGFHAFTKESALLDKLTDIPLYIAFAECAFFAFLGLYELIKRKSLLKVDRSIYALALIYIVMVVLYFVFDHMAINMRPVLIDGALEPSFPSTHTMMTLTIYGTGIVAFRQIYKNQKSLNTIVLIVSTALITFAVAGRLLCGIHWLSDIAGGLFIGATLIMLYKFLVSVFQ